jgi:hypothetical protein
MLRLMKITYACSVVGGTREKPTFMLGSTSRVDVSADLLGQAESIAKEWCENDGCDFYYICFLDLHVSPHEEHVEQEGHPYPIPG